VGKVQGPPKVPFRSKRRQDWRQDYLWHNWGWYWWPWTEMKQGPGPWTRRGGGVGRDSQGKLVRGINTY